MMMMVHLNEHLIADLSESLYGPPNLSESPYVPPNLSESPYVPQNLSESPYVPTKCELVALVSEGVWLKWLIHSKFCAAPTSKLQRCR